MAIKYLTILKRFYWILAFVPTLIYFIILNKYGQNFPHWDDYAIRGFIDKFQSSDSIYDKIGLIFSQHNEHRIAYTRIVALLIFKITGSINFLWLIWTGNLAILGILFVLIKVLKTNKTAVYFIVPVCFLLFQLSLFENTFWGMASVQNFSVILFSLLAFYQIAKNRVPYFWTFMAAFTSANGILFVPLIGFFAFFFTKSYRNLIYFTLFSLALVLLYFVDYHKPPDSQPIDITNISQNMKATFVNIGSFVDLNTKTDLTKRVFITFLFGIFLVATYFLVLVFKQVEKDDIKSKNNFNLVFFGSIFLFVLATCAVTTLSRIQYGFYVFLVSRYKIYSIIAICSLYLLLISCFQSKARKYIFILFLFSAIYLNFNTLFYSISDIANYKKSEIAAFYNGWHDKNDKIITHPNTSFNYAGTFLDNKPVEENPLERPILGKVHMDSEAITITNNDFKIKGTDVDDGAYLEFSSGAKRYIFAASQETLRSKKTFLFKKGTFLGKGFMCQIPLTELETGNYFINILEKNGEQLNKIPTNYYIEVEGLKPKKIDQNW